MGFQAVESARKYYDDDIVDHVYSSIWGGETICIGTFADAHDSIKTASSRTIDELAQLAGPLTRSSRVLDLGAGYGGSARYLAKTFGCQVTCLNLSPRQNARNESLCRQEDLHHLVNVAEGNFENVSQPDLFFDLIWSQDALLHSGDRAKVLGEIDRLLVQTNGVVVLTDIVQKSEVADPALFDLYMQRLPVERLATIEWYETHLKARGLQKVKTLDKTEHLATHYGRVLQEMQSHQEDYITHHKEPERARDYVDRSMKPLATASALARNGDLRWVWLIYRR